MGEETQAKLEKLARMEEKSRARSRRFLEKAKKDGKKQLSAIISGEAYDQLNRLRDAAQLAGKPTSFGQIIEKALACYINNPSCFDDNTNVDINDVVDVNINNNQGGKKKASKPIQETQTEMFNEMPDPSNAQEYRIWLFNQIDGLLQSGIMWAEITRRFNSSGVQTVSGTAWGRSSVQAFYKREKAH